MATRYNSKKLNNVNSGIEKIYFDKDKDSLFRSKGLDINHLTGRVKLAKELAGVEKADYSLDAQTLERGKLLIKMTYDFDKYIYFLAFNDTSNAVELWNGIPGAYNLKKDFTATYKEPCYLLNYKDKIIAQFQLTATDAFQIAYSSDGGTNFTITACPFENILSHTIGENDRLYITTNDKKIYTTDDGVTWTLFKTLPFEIAPSIVYFNSFIYLILLDVSSRQSKFCRIENDEIIVKEYLTHQFEAPANIIVQAERILIIQKINDTKILISEFNKNEIKHLSIINHTHEAIKCEFLTANDYYAIFSAGGRNLYKITTENGVFQLYDKTNLTNVDAYITTAIIWEENDEFGQLIILENALPDLYIAHQNLAKTLLTGYYTTPILDITHAPAYSIVKHDPLLATSSIAVKAKKNKESTFSTTLQTSNTLGAVSKRTAVKTLLNQQLDYVQFEVTLNDSAGAITGPKEVEFEYLFTPTNIENT